MWFPLLLILVAILLVPLIWFFAKMIKHGIKDLIKSSLIAIMITSILELILFFSILKLKIFFFMCKIGLDCREIFLKFIESFWYMTFYIFIIVLCVYYAIRVLKKSLKILFVIGGILLIGLAIFFLINNHIQKEKPINYCISDLDCSIKLVNGEFVSLNKNRIPEKEIINNESIHCIYKSICIDKKCSLRINENISSC